MNRTSLFALAAALLHLPLAAQVVIPLSPRDTFYRTNSDPNATDAFSLPIFALGVQAGDFLRLRCVGAWDNGVSGDVVRDMVGVFAGSGTLQPSSAQQRLTAPVAAGTAFAFSSGTAVGNLPMEIGEDFWISRTGFADEVLVKVPAAGSDLFICVPDAYYGDNSDPNTDFGVEITLVPGPHYLGTDEDLQLGTSIGAAPLDAFDVKTATAGNVVNIAIRSPLGTQAGSAFVIFLDATLTASGPPLSSVPGAWLSTAANTLQLAIIPAGGAPTTPLSLTVPAGYAGYSAWLQAGTLWTLARNNLFVATDAHEIRLQ